MLLRSRICDWRQHHRHQQQQLESSSRGRRGCTVVVVVTVFVIVAVQPHMICKLVNRIQGGLQNI